MYKKVLSIFFITILSFVLFACKTDEPKDETPVDTIPPHFVGAIGGELPSITHLKGEEINVLSGVVARDNIPDTEVIVTVIDWDGYDKDIPGEYTITIQAEDEAGNKSTVTRKIIVLETIVRSLSAIVIGDDFTEYKYNDPVALTFTPSGTAFRSSSIAQVMTKEFFIEKYNEFKGQHTNNGQVPFFPNGIIVILDNDFNVQLVRVGQPTSFEVNANGEVKSEDLTWHNGIDANNGGGMFKGIIEALEEAIPNGGHIMFAGNWGEQQGRLFLMRNFVFSGYEGGIVHLDSIDADYSDMEVRLEEEYTEIIALPDNLPSPVISIERHVLKWDAIPNANSYEVYIDGEHVITVSTTSLALADLQLDITPDDEDGYEIAVKAISRDIYQWSHSNLSDSVKYVMIELQTIDAPVASIDGNTLTWDFIAGAESYNVYIDVAVITSGPVLLDNVTENSYDLSSLADTYNANVKLFVKAIGDNEHYDSNNSNVVIYFVGTPQSIVFGDDRFNLITTTVEDYFARRNTDYNADKTGYANNPSVFLVTDIYNINTTNLNVTEAFGVIVLVDENGAPKLVRSILNQHQWTSATGWVADQEKYPSNSAQLSFLKEFVAEGDQLLIFRNTTGFEYYEEGVVTPINIRNLGAHLYVKNWVQPNGERWRDSMETFMDPSDVRFSIEDRKTRLEKPVVTFDDATGLLSWEAIANATGYMVYVNDAAPVLVTGLEFEIDTIDPDWATNGFDVMVVAADEDGNYLASIGTHYTHHVKQVVATPEIEIDGNIVSWEEVQGAASYDVYVGFAGQNIKVDNVTTNSFDATILEIDFAGYTNIYIYAIGDENHLDSEKSNSVKLFLGEIESLTIGDHTVDVIRTTAFNYFARRNTAHGTDNTGFAGVPMLFLITDIDSIKDPNFGVTATEAHGVIVLMDSNYNVKHIRNILTNQWTKDQGWYADSTYTNNLAQFDNIRTHISEGDMVLIGRNLQLTVEHTNGDTLAANARDLLAYHYIKPWATFPTAGGEGWRDPISTFIDPTDVTFTIEKKLDR